MSAFVGTLFGFALFVFLALLYFIGFVFWFQDVPRGGNLGGALAFAALTALTMASLGIALGAWFADRERAFQVLLATSVPFVFMCGIVFPREAMPAPINALAMLIPTTPGIFGFVKLNQMGASWSEIRPEFLNMAALLLLYALLAGWAVHWRRQGVAHMRRSRLCGGMAVALLLLAGCASRPSNPPLAQQDHDYGYRLSSWQAERGDPEFGLVVAMSGGGTRAAAFSYGILEELRRTEVPTTTGTGRLLDEVNIVTGISGGSFTALAYALYGERLFDEYEKRFLKRDVQGDLFGLVLNPLNWPQMSGGSFTRSDLAADYYDRILFEGATFGDLRGAAGPSPMWRPPKSPPVRASPSTRTPSTCCART